MCCRETFDPLVKPRPHGLFTQDPAFWRTVHLGGDGYEEQLAQQAAAAKAAWADRVVVKDIHFHGLPGTGDKASAQVSGWDRSSAVPLVAAPAVAAGSVIAGQQCWCAKRAPFTQCPLTTAAALTQLGWCQSFTWRLFARHAYMLATSKRACMAYEV
jgi:hypothetical protein